ncbi:MAG: ACT domain-containing protein [Alphaproteobacteria bacterium]|nr:ACT domain-containing protein [Alphaproteobacteria bacterium]
MRVIVMAVGLDRPGLTQSLADAIVEAGGNWLESHLARLGGNYVGSVLVDLPTGGLPDLKRAAARMDAEGFHVSVEAAAEEAAMPDRYLGFELVGADRPGIVREVATALAGLGVSIDLLETATEQEAWTGQTVFRARAEVVVPDTISFDTVRAALEDISGEILVDFDDD